MNTFVDDDDDEGFGDFVFAPNQSIPGGHGGGPIDFNGGFDCTTQKMVSVVNEDEDWGDFVTPSSHNPVSVAFNTVTTFQSNGFSALHPSRSLPSALTSAGLDPFQFQNVKTTLAVTDLPTMISVASDQQKVDFSTLHPCPSLPSTISSIGFDPFEFQNGNSAQPASDPLAVPDLKKVGFVKCKGPLPLSIFGADDDDGEEKEEGDGLGEDSGAGRMANGILDHTQSEITGNGSHLNPLPGINDILASLYAQSQPIKSDKGSNLNDSNILGSQSKSDPSLSVNDKGSDGEDDWDFKSATSAESNSEDQDTSESLGTKLASMVLSNQEPRIGMDQSSTVANGPGWKSDGTQRTGIFAAAHEESIANGLTDIANDFKSPSCIQNRFTPFPPSGSENTPNKTERDLIDDGFGDFMDASPNGVPKHQEDTTRLEINRQPWAAALSSNSHENDAVHSTVSNPRNDVIHQCMVNSICDVISKSAQVTPVPYNKNQTENDLHVTVGPCSATAEENGLNHGDEYVIKEKPSTQNIVAPKLFTSTELQIYLDFYTGLKKELCFLVSYLVDCAEKALDTDQVKESSKFQEVRKLLQDNMDSEELRPEKNSPRKICCSELLEVLRQPMFEILESEYLLSSRLHLAEKDLNMAVELLKEAMLSIKVLSLGTAEDQYTYVYTWATVVNACAQGLRHGACLWKQAIEKNLHIQIQSDRRGRRYIQSLGEIYRVSQIMGASAKAYKLWILLVSKQGHVSFFSLFDECLTLWSSSGLELALQNLLGASSSGTQDDVDVSIEALHKSIQNTHDTNLGDLFGSASVQQRSFCHLTLLSQEMLPELKMVSWNGENYFLNVVNLWANLISQEPPSLPHLQVS